MSDIRCTKCQGLLVQETAIDRVAGVAVEQLKCVNCGKCFQLPYAKVKPLKTVDPLRRQLRLEALRAEAVRN